MIYCYLINYPKTGSLKQSHLWSGARLRVRNLGVAEWGGSGPGSPGRLHTKLMMGLTGSTCRTLATRLQPPLLTTQISPQGCLGVLMTWQLALSVSDPRKSRGSCDVFYEWPRLRSHTVLLLPYWKANHWIQPLPKGRGINSLLLKGRAAKNLWTI